MPKAFKRTVYKPPLSRKLGKSDPDDEEAAAQAHLHGNKEEDTGFGSSGVGLDSGLGGIAGLVQRERELQRAWNTDNASRAAAATATATATATAPGVQGKPAVKAEPALPVRQHAYTKMDVDKPVDGKAEPGSLCVPTFGSGGAPVGAAVKRESLEVDESLRDATSSSTALKREPIPARLPPAATPASLDQRTEVDNSRPGPRRRSRPEDTTTATVRPAASAARVPWAGRFTLVELPQTPEQRGAARRYGVHATSYRAVPVAAVEPVPVRAPIAPAPKRFTVVELPQTPAQRRAARLCGVHATSYRAVPVAQAEPAPAPAPIPRPPAPAPQRFTLVELPQTREQRRAAERYGVHARTHRVVPIGPPDSEPHRDAPPGQRRGARC
ncbi:hypothetical protein MIND_00933300 [Mycena indigotica]|uniref:Uncharacterized protein n=1 Tax=Mycena indigotica TaxID=2126181 RepID=A0A8H6SFQ0_9AGAR|nr:uncharacterized protein MIND_00933300 [Mycena indigotica]KAF7297010.1 hypothetical protein MIND_00933300 [Mycena indigotica]